MKVYVYDSTTDEPMFLRIMSTLMGMRYMALVDEPYPAGKIAAFGFTPKQAARRARKNAHVIRRNIRDALVAEYDR